MLIKVLRWVDKFIGILVIFMANRIMFRYSFHKESYHFFTGNEIKGFDPEFRFSLFFGLQLIGVLLLFLVLVESYSSTSHYEQTTFLYDDSGNVYASTVKDLFVSIGYTLVFLSIYYPQYKIGKKLKILKKKETFENSEVRYLINCLFIFTQSYGRVKMNCTILTMLMPYIDNIQQLKAKHILSVYEIYLRGYERHIAVKPHRPYSYKVKWHLNYKVQYEIKNLLCELKYSYQISPWNLIIK